jgi:type I restriction enzyme S subunit
MALPEGGARLRILILRLAVRGRLVPEDSGDEPSEALLPRLHSAKQRLVQRGAIRATKPLPPISQSEVPFGVPFGWQWVRLVDLAWPQAGFAFKAAQFNDAGRGRPLIRIRDIDCDHTEAWFDGDYRSEFLVQTGAYLIGMDGNFNVRRWKGPEALLNQRVSRLVFYGHAEPAFVAMALQERLHELLGVKAYTTVQHLSGGQICEALVPLPPLAEQRRIVARVDELMGLLDRLEAARAKREATRTAARNSVLAALREADSPEAVDAAWTRFAQRMDDMLCDLCDIAPLRQTLLELAVRGHLVPQDPKDEPADVLLESIAAGSAKGTHHERRRQSQGDVRGGAVPFEVPRGWRWARFSDVAGIASNLVDPGEFPSEPHIAPDNIEKATGRLLAFRTIGEDGVTSGKHRFRAGQILYSKIRPNLSKVVTVDFGGLCSADMYPIDPWIDRGYLFRFMLSLPFIKQVTSDDNRLAMPKVNQEQLSAVLVPVPPLAEQRRIAGRIGDLMALLCNFEGRLDSAQSVHASFARAAMHHVVT